MTTRAANRTNERRFIEPRSRTFTGCQTCRTRHLKCDEARPVCATCRRHNLVCKGYLPQLLWTREGLPTAEQQQDHRSTSYRYPLFSEHARNVMSQDLVESLGDQSVSHILQELDVRPVTRLDHHLAGPFSVFRAFDSHDVTDQPWASSHAHAQEPMHLASFDSSLPHNLQEPHVLPVDADVPDHDDIDFWNAQNDGYAASLDTLSFSFENQMPAMMSTALPETAPWAEVLEEEVGVGSSNDECAAHNQLPSSGFFADTHQTCSSMLASLSDLTASPWNQFSQSAQKDLRQEETPDEATLAPPGINFPRGACSLPSHATVLLQYLKAKVLESSSSPSFAFAKARVSPWKILLLPCALQTYAEISLWNVTSYTRRSILSTLLAKSATHLHTCTAKHAAPQSASSEWHMVAIEHQRNASMYLKLALKTEFIGAKQAEYTELLMAILGVLLGQVNSRPVGKFRIHEDHLGNLDALQDKPDEVGYNDIHLDVSGYWRLTMFPEMYGIPESLMTLLSQTISIANEKPNLERSAQSNQTVSASLTQHIRTLENQIWAWSPRAGPPRPSTLVTTDTALSERPESQSLTSAMHQTLIIYFYRRIHQMSALVLQEQVRQTLDYLDFCLDMEGCDQEFALTVGWMLFVALCEAATAELQGRGLDYLSAVDKYGCFIAYDTRPSAVIKSVWHQREESGDYTQSWVNSARQDEMVE